jgi:hypothetical protein
MRIDFDHIRQKIDENKYPVIGYGTGRIVYDAENSYVIKVARNDKGIAQNKAEQRIASLDQNSVFAKIIAVSDDSKYLIMEKAEKINSISEVWKHYQVRNNRELFQLEQFRGMMSTYGLLYADLYRKDSWGLIEGRPVIIDYGFTKETRKYYFRGFNFMPNRKRK